MLSSGFFHQEKAILHTLYQDRTICESALAEAFSELTTRSSQKTGSFAAR